MFTLGGKGGARAAQPWVQGREFPRVSRHVQLRGPQEERAPCPYWAATPQTLPGPGRPCREQSPGPAGTRLPQRVAGLVSRPEGSAWRWRVLTGSQTHEPWADRGGWTGLVSSRQSEEAASGDSRALWAPPGWLLVLSRWLQSPEWRACVGRACASLLRDRGTRKLPPQGRPPCCLPGAHTSPPPPISWPYFLAARPAASWYGASLCSVNLHLVVLRLILGDPLGAAWGGLPLAS